MMPRGSLMGARRRSERRTSYPFPWLALVVALLFTVLQGALGAAQENKAPSPAKLRNQGDSAFMQKDYAKALKLFSKAVALEPENHLNYYKRFRVYDKMRKSKSALSDLTATLERKPDYTTAYGLRARLLLQLGRCPEAAADYERVLKLKPEHRDAGKLLPKARDCGTKVEAAERYVQRGDWRRARDSLDAAMEVTGSAPHLRMLRARARYELGEYEYAIADTAAILKEEKDNVDAILLRGRAYYRTLDHDMAMKHVREALKFDPEHAETKSFYRQLKKLTKQYDAAEAALKRANHDGLVEALEGYQAALKVDPLHTEFVKTLHLRICKCHAKLKDVPAARAACGSALKIDGSLIEGHTIIAELLSKTAEEPAEFEEAVRAWQRAREASGNNDRSVLEGLQRAEAALKQSKQKNYYKTLGLKRDAETSQIKRAYRKLALDFHPDKHADKSEEERKEMERQFQEVAEAYEVLSDDELRGKYDRGEDVFENQGGGPQQRRGGFPFGNFGGFQSGGRTFSFKMG